MKELEFDIQPKAIDRLYDLEIIQNKYVGLGFDPDLINLENLYKTENVFNEIYGTEDATDLISNAKVDGKDLRTYMKNLLLTKDIVTLGMSDLDRYCKAFIL